MGHFGGLGRFEGNATGFFNTSAHSLQTHKCLQGIAIVSFGADMQMTHSLVDLTSSFPTII